MKNRLLFFCCYWLFLAVFGAFLEGLYNFFCSGGYFIKTDYTHLCFDGGIYQLGGVFLFYTTLFFYQKLKYPLFNPLGKKLYGRPFLKKIHLTDIIISSFLGICLTLMELTVFYVFLKFGIRFYCYAKEKYDFLGIICLRASLGWFLIAVFFYFILFPIIYNMRYKMINNTQLQTRKFWPVFICLVIYLGDVISGIYMMYNFYKKHPEMNDKKIYFPYASHREKAKKIKYYPEECF